MHSAKNVNGARRSESDLAQRVREYANGRIRPLVNSMDADAKIHSDVLSGLFQAGWMGVQVPTIYGGTAGTFSDVCVVIEEVSRVDPAVAVYVHIQNSLVINALLMAGTAKQKRRYLPMLRKNVQGAYAVSEAGAGSDAFGMTTVATPVDEGFVLNGAKCWTSGAVEAGLFLVFAKVQDSKVVAAHTGDTITAFLVERAAKGLEVGQPDDKLGVRACSTAEVRLREVFVPRDAVVGSVGTGGMLASDTLNEGRIGIGAQMLGLARGSLDAAVAYAREREQFDRPIAEYQAVHFRLAELATELEAARLMVREAARLVDGKPSTEERFRTAAMAKLFAARAAERIASEAVEIFGGRGYTKDAVVEKLLRDAKVGKIYEGTSNMLLRTVARTMLGSRFVA